MSARCSDLTNAWLSGGRIVVESGGDDCTRKRLAYYDIETDTFTDISIVTPANARAECTTLYFADRTTVYAFDNSSGSATRVLALVADNWVQIATGSVIPSSTRFVALDPGHVIAFVPTTDLPYGRVLELRVEVHR